MLTVRGSPVRLCDGMTRRDWLHAGALSTIGLGLPQFLQARAETRHPGRARACIVVFLFGAPAHQDIWDPKPDARPEYRGEFKTVSTNVPGTLVGEHIPRMARLADRFALVRSVSHPDDIHTVAMHYMLTGIRHLQPETNPQRQATDFPCFGAVLRYLRHVPGSLPSGVSLNAPANQVSANNHIFPGFFAGFLGRAYDPLFVADDPSEPDFSPFPALAGEPTDRLVRRRSLLSTIEDQRRAIDRVAAAVDYDRYHQKAFDLVTSPAARRAFDLARESDRTRDRYGRNHFGQALLLARRLVEAGVSLVTVNWARNDAFWDTHANNFQRLKRDLLPPFDLGFSALLEDLDQRGLLDETLVYCLGEFGRTPAINKQAGRDHWGKCNSVVLAGAGVRGGLVLGASDRNAAFPVTPPVSPSDLSATVYETLGIDRHTELRDHLGRPLLLSPGRPLAELFA